jgi:hypothetical protein
MEYILNEYINPISIEGSIKYKKLSESSVYEITELAKIYCTLFNADNIKLIKKLGIQGRTNRGGLWDEETYTLDRCNKIICDYVTGNYFGVIALGRTKTGESVIGASVYETWEEARLLKKGYTVPFKIPEGVKVWCEADTFRRDVKKDHEKLKYLAKGMRNFVLETYKGNEVVLICSSTNNPVMVKSWKEDGFTIVEKFTAFGNKFQSFKLVY